MKVVVLGGGVAGLSAAHELAERGFEVVVYEQRSTFGGKARSIEIPGTATGGRRPLPGEHGFRFFPGFYKHLPDTMSRIPFRDGSTVDNLVPATQMLLARHRADEIVVPSGPPTSWREAMQLVHAASGGTGIPFRELLHFWTTSVRFMTSCEARRRGEYEYLPWWSFIDADARSDHYQRFLAEGATRSLVAMQAAESSTRTIGRIYFQMLRDLAHPGIDVDRVLNGPTNEVWIDPWVEHLRSMGVVFEEARVSAVHFDGKRARAAEVTGPSGTEEVEAEFFVLALPVEVVRDVLLTPEFERAAPKLRDLYQLETSWMNGIQFYLDRDVVISHGHGLYLDSTWALTSISQAQFWERDLSDYGDGHVRGILSVCISDWKSLGIGNRKAAEDCSPEEIRDEVWHQLELHLHDDEFAELDAAEVVHWFLDDSIVYPNPNESINMEPLLINTVGSWDNRPDSDVGLDNLFLASDYVRTNTDLATMEAANEAARRAVNNIIDRSSSAVRRCEVWPLLEPGLLDLPKALDNYLFERDEPHVFDVLRRVMRR